MLTFCKSVIKMTKIFCINIISFSKKKREKEIHSIILLIIFDLLYNINIS